MDTLIPRSTLQQDEERDFVQEHLNTESFPPVNFVKSDGSVVTRSADDFANFEKSVKVVVA